VLVDTAVARCEVNLHFLQACAPASRSSVL
jgi:hypothetical protein